MSPKSPLQAKCSILRAIPGWRAMPELRSPYVEHDFDRMIYYHCRQVLPPLLIPSEARRE
jgi:hypothetical protein